MKPTRQQHHLRREIQSASQIAIFVQARAHHPVLARYGSVIELLEVVESTDSDLFLEKEQLIQFILTEHEERPQPLWAALLLLACFPMLITLSRRIQGQSRSADECKQVVFSSFLEIVSAYPSDSDERVFMHLRQLTHRRVFKLVHKEKRTLKREPPTPPELLLLYEVRCLDEHRHAPWPAVRPGEEPTVGEREEKLALLKAYASAVLSPDKQALVIATLVEGLQLRSYVKRMYPSVTGDEQRRLYQRIKRRHSRAVQELRERFTSRWQKIMAARAKATR
jgi:hypothetical protein